MVRSAIAYTLNTKIMYQTCVVVYGLAPCRKKHRRCSRPMRRNYLLPIFGELRLIIASMALGTNVSNRLFLQPNDSYKIAPPLQQRFKINSSWRHRSKKNLLKAWRNLIKSLGAANESMWSSHWFARTHSGAAS